jgi:hypothetical protein
MALDWFLEQHRDCQLWSEIGFAVVAMAFGIRHECDSGKIIFWAEGSKVTQLAVDLTLRILS